MDEEMLEELRQEIQQLDQLLKELGGKVEAIDKKVNKINRQTTPFWEKFKQKIKRMAKKPTITGRILKKMIKFYGISWRYLYCITERRKGIQNNKIVFISHRGGQYSCNPMYLSRYLLEHYPGKFEIVWAFNDPRQFSYLKEEGIRVVKKESKEHLKHLVTAKVIVTNVDFFVYLPKVKGQIALDTWHGGGSYKTCGFANAQNLLTVKKKRHFKRLYSKVNLYCSSSRAFTRQTIRESRLFKGEVLEVGMPRNDILINHDQPQIEKKVRDYFSLDEETKIVLYAPTYRSAAEMGNIQRLDIRGLNEALSRRFGGTWRCLYRTHHLGASADMIEEADEGQVLSAARYPDMQELLYTADVLVSDYSSCIWDFSLQYRPVFLYCPDLDRYTGSRDFYMPIEDWHFILARDQKELEEKILDFREAEYREGIRQHHMELESCESGRATEQICERIYAECFSEE